MVKTSDKTNNDYVQNYEVLEGMADWVRVVDKNNMVIYANKTMKEALGEQIVNDYCHNTFKKETPCRFCVAKRSISTGEVIQKEEEYDGKIYSVKTSPIRDAFGKIYAAVEVFRDVTRERKLERALVERNKNMRQDIQFATRIQERILPDKHLVNDLKFDYIYQPSQMLSGDIFDIIPLDEETVGIYVSDVAGHGVSASMMTMFIHHTVRNTVFEVSEPSELLKQVHQQFIKLDLTVEQYFSLLYARYNVKTGEFVFANAGHNCAPLLLSHNRVTPLEVTGFPIMNLRKDLEFEQKSVQLKRGDRVLFYTDGCVELRDIEGNMLGVEGLMALYQAYGTRPLSELYHKVMKFAWGEQRDDYAMLLMEVEKNPKEVSNDKV